MVSQGEAALAFEDVPSVAKQTAIESRAVGLSWLGGTAISEGPVPGVELVHHAPRVSARVGRIVPGAVIHHSPGHELGAWIVRIGIVVEEIREGETADGNRVASHGAVAGKLVGFALEVLFLRAETEIVRNIEAGNVGLGCGSGHAGQFAVRCVGDAVHAAESAASGNFRIEIELGIITELKPEE